jgi:hypothetical protein
MAHAESEHTCHKCEGGNDWPPDTLGHDRYEFALAMHLALWSLIHALRIPQAVDLFARSRPARVALVLTTAALLVVAFLTAPEYQPPEGWLK